MFKVNQKLIAAKRVLKVEVGTQIQAAIGCNLIIGAYSYIRPDTILSGTKSIGRYCSIARGVAFGGS